MEYFDIVIRLCILVALVLLLRALRTTVYMPMKANESRTTRLEERVTQLEYTSAEMKINHREFQLDIQRALAPVHVRLDQQDGALREIKELLEERLRPPT